MKQALGHLDDEGGQGEERRDDDAQPRKQEDNADQRGEDGSATSTARLRSTRRGIVGHGIRSAWFG